MTAVSHLKRITIFKNLSQRDLKRIAAISQTREFPSGTILFKKDDAADHMFVVVSGRIKIYSRSSAKKRKTFAYLGRGDFFGEMSAVDDYPRSASAEAVDATKLLFIHKRDFKRLLLSDAKLCFELLKAVSARLRRANEEIEGLLFGNILGRVSKTIYDLAQRAGQLDGGSVVISQRFTHQELADLVGTTREPLSRALSMLRRAELVESKGGTIVIRDLAKLESLIRTSLQTD